MADPKLMINSNFKKAFDPIMKKRYYEPTITIKDWAPARNERLDLDYVAFMHDAY